jgi:hypothetical protein
MIGDRDYDVCACGHIRAEHEGNGDGKGPCAQRVRNETPDQSRSSHYDPCPCLTFAWPNERRTDTPKADR